MGIEIPVQLIIPIHRIDSGYQDKRDIYLDNELIQTYSQNPAILNEEINLGLTEDQLRNMLEDYKIKLSYHLAKNDGDAISNSIRTMTNRSLRDIGVKEIVQRPLT